MRGKCWFVILFLFNFFKLQGDQCIKELVVTLCYENICFLDDFVGNFLFNQNKVRRGNLTQFLWRLFCSQLLTEFNDAAFLFFYYFFPFALFFNLLWTTKKDSLLVRCFFCCFPIVNLKYTFSRFLTHRRLTVTLLCSRICHDCCCCCRLCRDFRLVFERHPWFEYQTKSSLGIYYVFSEKPPLLSPLESE